MITVLLLAGALVFGIFFGHVVGFGVRTRRTRLRERPVSRRDEHDRRWVGLRETHRPDADLPPCRLNGDR
ncbi:hypothetical protein ACRYCC_39545 [Actinomadura scrupuli]|uniref:hypothetical protein n=1 Tax=Actinomadura scrupuli TaxID=559629 RepID=UPI003D98C34C